MMRCGLTVIVPCYNESQRLDCEAFRSFAAQHVDITFLFVNDGSTDNTAELLQQLSSSSPQLKLINLPQNAGKAEAVRQGLLAAADAPLVAYWDADLATPLEAIDTMRQVFERRADIDVVAGVRLPLLGHAIQRRPLRRLLGRGFAWCASRALGLSMVDTQCGAKMFRQCDALRASIAEPFASRWIFDVELLVRWRQFLQQSSAGSLCRRLYELPLDRWDEVGGSHLKARDFVRAIGELLAIYRRRTHRLPTPAVAAKAPVVPRRAA